MVGTPVKISPFQCPLLQRRSKPFHITICGDPRGSTPIEYCPREGSLAVFQEVKTRFSPDSTFMRTLMSGRYESVGSLKLCQKAEFGSPILSLLERIRLPVSPKIAVVLFDTVEVFLDQTEFPFPSKTTRLPLSSSFITPASPDMGFSLFATQTTDRTGIWSNHIPTYLYVEFSGLKNPRTNFWPAEIMVSPSLIDWPCVMLSAAEQNRKK